MALQRVSDYSGKPGATPRTLSYKGKTITVDLSNLEYGNFTRKIKSLNARSKDLKNYTQRYINGEVTEFRLRQKTEAFSARDENFKKVFVALEKKALEN